MEAAEVETRELLQKLFPNVSLPPDMVREVGLTDLLGAGFPLHWCSATCPCSLFSQGFSSGKRVLPACEMCAW